jgi:FRG domain
MALGIPASAVLRMKSQEVSSWASWKEIISQLLDQESKQVNGELCISPLLFRGHKCSSWRLESTIERKGRSSLPSIDEYGTMVEVAKHAFESYTNNVWVTAFDNADHPSPPKNYEFIVYLRHHGFPTPILDWTRSPYIASFFAFQHPSPEKTVAIYSFREYADGGSSESQIVGCGPTIRTHRRHYIQQAEYTFCRKKIGSTWHYGSHEEALQPSNDHQDIATRYIIPSCIRAEALADLDAMNINAYSLYGSEESLAEMLANRIYRYDS